jgi:ribosomal protein S18 acetylase RimI-like enzyme
MQTNSPVSLLDQVHIRKAIRQDLAALEWNGEYAHFRRLYQDIYQSAQRGEAILWVAELPGEDIVGQMFVQLSSLRPELADGRTQAYIYGFRVRPAYRGKGIGTFMLEMVEGDLVRRGFRKVVLNVNQDNADARRLYERNGYRVVAEEEGRWSYLDQYGRRRQVNEPAWRMEKALIR